MRIEIGTEGNADHPDVFLLPCNVAHRGINADVQNLGIQGRELFFSSIEFGDLRGSGGSPVERVKCDYQVLFAAVVAQADYDLRLSHDCGKREIWSGVSNFERHGYSLASGFESGNSGSE